MVDADPRDRDPWSTEPWFYSSSEVMRYRLQESKCKRATSADGIPPWNQKTDAYIGRVTAVNAS